MRTTLTLLTAILVIQACGPRDDAATDTAAPATAPMRDAAGRDLGTLTLTEGPQGLSVSGRLTGLTPGEHGIHIHMAGQCTPPFTTAGAHWNPTSKQHGSQNPQGPHLGDLPNLSVGADS